MVKRGLMCMLLVLLAVIPVRANDATGSIKLTMRWQQMAVPGGTVTVYDVTELDVSEKPDALYKSVKAKGIPGITREIKADGTAEFPDLHTGCYLLVQEDAAPGYLNMNPFCVSIPVTVADQVTYQIEAFPKLERIPGTKLPQTGQLRLPAWGLMGCGLMLTALGILLQKRE